MSRDVKYDGSGAFHVRFPFDRALVERIKTLPSRRWNAEGRHWWVPAEDVVRLVDLLLPERFSFDLATREQYFENGGTLLLEDGPGSVGTPTLPGLFDLGPEALPREPADYSVSRLNEQVKQVLEAAFPQPIWLVGEISGFNRNAHKRHASFQLAEHGPDGRNLSSVDATLFEHARQTIEKTLAQAQDPFRFEDEITVRLRVRVELHVPWGSYRVLVEDIDVHFTLGEAARRREEILRRLAAAGLLERNSALPLPPFPLRVGLVTSLHSDAYNDVLRSLEESGYAFRVVAHGARVQGHATEPSVLNALAALARRADELDAVLICRGGGSRTDLAWFDSEALGRAVALFPLPVIVGIGHERDFSVLDSVARRAKTPTAAAALLVETVRRSLERIETAGRAVLEAAAERIGERRRHDAERARQLARAARTRIDRERAELGHRLRRAGRAGRTALSTARERLARQARDLPKTSWISLTRQRSFLDSMRKALVQGTRRDIGAAQTAAATWARVLGPRGAVLVAREVERTESRARRLHLVDPRRVIERGYAILRLAGGQVLSAARTAPPGTAVRAELRQGALRLRSEGMITAEGGE